MHNTHCRVYAMATLNTSWPSVPYQLLFYFIGAVSGVLIHRTLFIHGEWHIQAPMIIIIHTTIASCLALGTHFAENTGLEAVLRALVSISWGYLPGLITSIFVYRMFFHPLTRAGFPGPWYAPISKIWHVWSARQGQNHLVLAALHEKYGDFVRTGMLLVDTRSRWLKCSVIIPLSILTDE